MRRHRILIAPLDWGLGHATRCIPIIRMLHDRDIEVIIAADGRPYDLLKKEFPRLEFLRFPGFTIHYPSAGRMSFSIVKQLPGIMREIKNEYETVNRMIAHYNIDAVISDSRFGAYSKKVPSIIVIHQLRILMPQGLRWAESIVASFVRHKVNNFSECWIPDRNGIPNCSGKLSHGVSLPHHSQFIGPLSRFEPRASQKKEFDIIAILSGPEPQRTLFEEILLEQLKKSPYRAFVVRGIPERSTRIKLTESITAVSSLTSDELAKAIAISDIVISRPGYSTVMDLSRIGSKAIFCPTPQQTEQEYLAALLRSQNICYSEPQDSFDLERALAHSKTYTGFAVMSYDPSTVQSRIEHLQGKIEQRTT